MAKYLYFPDYKSYLAGQTREGITIAYIHSRRVLEVGGWYNSEAKIEKTEIPLTEFLAMLGITSADIERSMQYVRKQQSMESTDQRRKNRVGRPRKSRENEDW